MKLRIFSLAVASAVSLISFSSYAEQSPSAPAPAFSNDADRASYAIGADIGHNFKQEGIQLNPEVMAQGMKDAISGNKLRMDPKEMQTTLMGLQKELMTKHQAKIQAAGDKNKSDGEAFLAENKGKSGVVTLPDGLQYKIIKQGEGVSPTEKDSVTVNYEGTLTNGQVFDSSYARGKPFTFQINEVIPGWTEALKMMKPGAEWMIYIPSALGYGERGAGPIGPNQTLIFKVNLIAVQPAATATTQDSKK